MFNQKLFVVPFESGSVVLPPVRVLKIFVACDLLFTGFVDKLRIGGAPGRVAKESAIEYLLLSLLVNRAKHLSTVWLIG